MVHEPTPAARIATISLSLPMREKPMIIPARARQRNRKDKDARQECGADTAEQRERQVGINNQLQRFAPPAARQSTAVSSNSEIRMYGAIAPTMYLGIRKFLNLKFCLNKVLQLLRRCRSDARHAFEHAADELKSQLGHLSLCVFRQLPRLLCKLRRRELFSYSQLRVHAFRDCAAAPVAALQTPND